MIAAEPHAVVTPIASSRSETGMALVPEPDSIGSNGHERLEDITFDPSLPDAPQRARAVLPTKPPARKPHEIEYMRHQGVFKQLPEDVSEILLRQYFEHVHFFLPILDASTLLNEVSRASQGIDPLLLWSIYLASANVCISRRRIGPTSSHVFYSLQMMGFFEELGFPLERQ